MSMQAQIKVSAELDKSISDRFINRVKSYERSDVILLNVSECFDKIYVEILAPISIINALNGYIDFLENGLDGKGAE